MGGVGKSSGDMQVLSLKGGMDQITYSFMIDQSWLSILTTSVWDNVQIYAQANSNR